MFPALSGPCPDSRIFFSVWRVAVFASLDSPDFSPLKTLLQALAQRPPQVLLLEGGSEEQRLEMAFYWAACCQCPQALRGGAPCLSCPSCLQIAANEHLDLCVYDGRISNRDDEENPGPVRALSMENLRQLKQQLRDAPHGEGRRVIVLVGLTGQRAASANALLKALEEPSPHNVFVLLAPQREQLLPTLVSRSLCLTLPWPDPLARNAAPAEWVDAFGMFLQCGRGLFEKTTARNALDAQLAQLLVLSCQKALARVLSGAADPASPLDTALMPLSSAALASCAAWCDEALEALRQAVTPARVIEALACRLHVLRGGR